MNCIGCKLPVLETQKYVTCLTCDAQSHFGCNSHCICDDIAPNRAGDGAFGSLLRDVASAKGMSMEDLCHLL